LQVFDFFAINSFAKTAAP